MPTEHCSVYRYGGAFYVVNGKCCVFWVPIGIRGVLRNGHYGEIVDLFVADGVCEH